MECVIDTNALIYDTLEDSEHHKAARAVIDSAELCVIPSVVIEEFVTVLAKLGVDKKIIYQKVLEILDSFEYAPVEKEDVLNALDTLKGEYTSYKRFNDKLVLRIAMRRGAQLLTFDRELRKEQEAVGLGSPI